MKWHNAYLGTHVQTGIAALVIANKYEEVYGPLLREYESICAGAYTRADILKMERIILKTLDFGLTVPTTFTFLNRYIKASGHGMYVEFKHLAQYLCEWSLLSYTCLRWSGSLIASAATYATFVAFNVKQGAPLTTPRVMGICAMMHCNFLMLFERNHCNGLL
jgi:Cyclin, C-terminal domain/Cyclin, N-terminal domain